MAKKKKNEPVEILPEDAGSAFVRWYSQMIKEYPNGVVSQAQAAAMLSVDRMTVHRLISRGHLRAEYFPKTPDLGGLVVGQDDPTWFKLGMLFGEGFNEKAFPRAIFVSFEDVEKLWESGEAQKKGKFDWKNVFFDKENVA